MEKPTGATTGASKLARASDLIRSGPGSNSRIGPVARSSAGTEAATLPTADESEPETVPASGPPRAGGSTLAGVGDTRI